MTLGRPSTFVGALALLAALVASRPAHALRLELRSEERPFEGITWSHYRTSSPATNTWVARVDLCAAGVRVEATRPATQLQTTGAWAQGSGVQLATNGDFYRPGPVHVYGDAVGQGVRWPLGARGNSPDYEDDWFFARYGWIAFGHDWVEFMHTRRVKRQADGLRHGWHPDEVVQSVPPGTLALVSGFPELVIEGRQVTCEDPRDGCFPDRSDMHDRHPRTAMGLTEDRQTFLLVVVDGRTGSSAGMLGAELADLMAQLGAWEAFNLDGGGSSQMWVQGEGYVNDYGGNNGGGARAVANHWGMHAGGGAGARPGHCVRSPPCQVLPAAGGLVDDASPCFEAFGPPEYWRQEATGHGGHLLWTNAFASDLPSNWAWWQLNLAAAGRYEVEILSHAEFGVFARTGYAVLANGTLHSMTVDQGASAGWISLGQLELAAAGRQHVQVFDAAAEPVAAGQHITVDAVRLTRLDPWCGDEGCNGDETCQRCPEDCGPCPPECGDRSCEPPESCQRCPEDCGPCPPECGDGRCDPSERCETCPADCGECPRPPLDGGCGATDTCDAGVGDLGWIPPDPPDVGSPDAAALADQGLGPEPPPDGAGAVADVGGRGEGVDGQLERPGAERIGSQSGCGVRPPGPRARQLHQLWGALLRRRWAGVR